MKKLLPIFLLVASISTAFGQQKPTFNEIPFNLQAEKLPPKFAGNNPFAIVDALRGREKALGKGEFETTAGWKDRVSTFKNKPYLGALLADSLLAFVVRSADDVTFTYNADAKLFVAILPLKPDFRNVCLHKGG